jgi:hypothetical protein
VSTIPTHTHAHTHRQPLITARLRGMPILMKEDAELHNDANVIIYIRIIFIMNKSEGKEKYICATTSKVTFS